MTLKYPNSAESFSLCINWFNDWSRMHDVWSRLSIMRLPYQFTLNSGKLGRYSDVCLFSRSTKRFCLHSVINVQFFLTYLIVYFTYQKEIRIVTIIYWMQNLYGFWFIFYLYEYTRSNLIYQQQKPKNNQSTSVCVWGTIDFVYVCTLAFYPA